jgi:hypothetical protein
MDDKGQKEKLSVEAHWRFMCGSIARESDAPFTHAEVRVMKSAQSAQLILRGATKDIWALGRIEPGDANYKSDGQKIIAAAREARLLSDAGEIVAIVDWDTVVKQDATK